MNSPVFRVSEFTLLARTCLENAFTQIHIEGEISNFIIPASGHWYFSLKDDKAQVRCVMFRPKNLRVTTTPKEGDHVFLTATASLYEPRGDFQLIVDKLEQTGEGQLQRAFETLKERLSREGLFDAARKKLFPAEINTIGVITSASGAALQDILITLKRRYPAIAVIIYPSQVQGTLAAAELVRALQLANQRQECDALILARGGGSLEDLWPFNEEIVARAIAASQLPIVTGIGHEIDFTIADFVADHRAATPTAAAEFISPNKTSRVQQLQYYREQLLNRIRVQYQHTLQTLQSYHHRLLQQHPIKKLQQQQQLLDQWQLRLINAITQLHKQARIKFISLTAQLNTLSPLATLARGYTISDSQGTIIRTIKTVSPGNILRTQVIDGEIFSLVQSTQEKS